MTSTISIVVPTRDRPELLDGCLAALRASLRDGDEIVVADSASADLRVREVAESHGARYIRCELPGASRARNAGWRACRREIVAFVDDDIRVDPGWAAGIVDAFADPGVTFVTGKIGEPDEATGPRVAQLEGNEPRRLGADTAGVIGHSANIAVRRRALEVIGGFDELLGAGARFRAAEDLDLFDRLFAAGYIGRYEPAASAVHESWRRLREFVRLQGDYGYGAGARVAKLMRRDRVRGMHAAKSAFVTSGFATLGRALRERRRTAIAARSLRIVTTTAGFVRGMVTPVRDGRFGRGY